MRCKGHQEGYGGGPATDAPLPPTGPSTRETQRKWRDDDHHDQERRGLGSALNEGGRRVVAGYCEIGRTLGGFVAQVAALLRQDKAS